MNESHWGKAARAVIAGVKEENPEADPKELRRLLRIAYPFTMRKYHPYKVWCKEVRIALGEIKRGQKQRKPRTKEIPKGQAVLF